MFTNKAFMFSRPLAAPATPGTPPAIAPSSLRVWLEATDKVYNTGTTLATNGQTVSSWGGLGTTTANATANTGTAPAPTFQTNVVNGLPAVRFNSQALFLGNILTGWPAGSVFLVTKTSMDPPTNTALAGAPLENWGSYNQYFDHQPYTDGTVYNSYGSTTRQTVGNPTPSLASQFRFITIRSKAGQWNFRLDGTQLYNTTTNTVGWGTAPALGRGTATYISGATVYWVGDLFAVVACNAYLSDADATSMESYLTGRVGTQTPPPTDGNDTLETATDLGTVGVGTVNQDSSFTPTDPADWYKFTVGPDGLSVTIRLTNMTANFDLYFHGTDGSEWSHSTNTGNYAEELGMYLYGGVYWVRVTNPESATGTYTLVIEGS